MTAMTLLKAVMITTANTLLRSQTVSFRLRSNYGKMGYDSITSTTLPKNMILHHCTPVPSITATTTPMNTTIQNSIPISYHYHHSRPLVVIMAWLLAKDTHLEKYREMWFRRGCDVLTVRTSPIDLLLPPIGGKIVANNLTNYLLQINRQYRQILIHAFSVGGYQFGLFLSKLRSTNDFAIIGDSIRGVICDSIVFTDDCAPGLSRTITSNPVLQPMFERSIYLFLQLFHDITVKHYEHAMCELFDMYLRCPALVFFSEDDVISNTITNKRLVCAWNELGMRVQSKCWHTSIHVSHYREHTREYEQQIDVFLKIVNLHNYAADDSVA